MNTVLTITDKGQITLSKAILISLALSKGDKIAVSVKNQQAILTPAGRGILDLAGKMGKLHLLKGQTIDQLIEKAKEEEVEKEIR